MIWTLIFLSHAAQIILLTQVIFLRADFADLVVEKPSVAQALTYSDWLLDQANKTIQGNNWIQTATRSYSKIMAKPQACFDTEFYIMVGDSICMLITSGWQCLALQQE